MKMLATAWKRFWFLPADPTTLGLMRIVTGCVLLYVHLAYCLELFDFFGPQGWLSRNAANKERREMPIFAAPLEWRQPPPVLRLPETPLRRQAVFQFFRRFPDDPNQRMSDLLFVTTLLQTKAEIEDRRKFFAEYARLTAEQRTALKRAIAAKSPDLVLPLPAFWEKSPPSTIVDQLDEADSLARLLDAGNTRASGYVLDWFQDLPTVERLRAFEFIKDLPRSRAERDELLNYYEFWGVDPRTIYSKGKEVFSPWFHLHDRDSIKAVHACILVVFFLFTIGLWTRMVSVLSWLAALGYMHRTPPILFGIDTMLSILLLYLMIGPSGSALSLDRLRARWRAARALIEAGSKNLPWAETTLEGPPASLMANFTLRLFQIHFCFIYLSTGLAKVRGATWWNHSAGWMTLVNPGFSLIHNHTVESIVLGIAEIRPLLGIICAGLIIFTLALELFFPVLVWTRLRPYMVIGAIFLHSSIAFLMGLTPFGLIMLTLLLSYFSASVVRQAPSWIIRRGSPVMVRYDERNTAHRRTVARIRALDVAGQVMLQPANVKEVQVTSQEALGDSLAKSLALLRPFRWAPGMRMIARRLFPASRAA